MEKQEIGASLCVIDKVQTTRDGGARITLDIPSVSSSLIGDLMHMKLTTEGLVMVAFVKAE